jgi:hypothetical protein
MNTKEKIDVKEIEKETVLGLLASLPDDGLLHLGAGIKPQTREDLIQHVRDYDEIGKVVIDIYMNYLRSFKELSK